ncbi:MAG: hypothetical protein N3B15_02655 [Planctomycetota bacterium]|nr:hypothetical protein [Planctomycetota bacterium]
MASAIADADAGEPRAVESEIERLRKKVENFPSPSSYARLAELLHLAKQDFEAEAVCRKCIKEFPRQAQPFVILAEIQMATGRHDAVGESLRAALERDPRHYAAARMYADWLEQRQDLSGALTQLKQILSYRPDDAQVKQRIAELQARQRAATGTAPPKSAPAMAAAPPRAAAAAAAVGDSSGSRAVPGVRRSAFELLAGESGIHVCAVIDERGEVLLARNHLARAGAEEILAAHAAAVDRALGVALRCLGQPRPSSWVLSAECGQVLAFRRQRGPLLAAFADASVRPALIELRALQALVDLGTA